MDDDRILRIWRKIEALSDEDRDALLAELDNTTAGRLRDLLGGAAAQTAQASPALREGDEFAGYTIVTFIGRGGFGEVWRVRHRMKDIDEALKVIKPCGAMTSYLVTRFREEISHASKLEHDNVVRIYTAGEESGRLFFTMQLVNGKSLSDRIAAVYDSTNARNAGAHSGAAPASSVEGVRGKYVIDPHDAARYVMQASRGVACAHRAAIIHRDIKPGNLLLSSSSDGDGQQERVLVSDFGLALLQDEGAVSAASAGTPRYMAPEQSEGLASTRSDIYALGATLVALLAGKPPKRCATRRDRLADLVFEDTPLPKIDMDLEAICMKCLQRDPDRRYNDAEDLARDLANYLSYRPVNARRRAKRLRWLLGPLWPGPATREK